MGRARLPPGNLASRAIPRGGHPPAGQPGRIGCGARPALHVRVLLAQPVQPALGPYPAAGEHPERRPDPAQGGYTSEHDHPAEEARAARVSHAPHWQVAVRATHRRLAERGGGSAGFATEGHTPRGRGFDSSLGYIAGAYNGYLHGWSSGGSSGTPHGPPGASCAQFPGVVRYPSDANGTVPRPGEAARCTSASVLARHLGWTTDLWEAADGREGPAHGVNLTMNGTGFEEELFTQRAVNIIEHHQAEAAAAGSPGAPMFLYYAMHLLHSPLCAPPALLDRFAAIENEDRRYVAAMAAFMDESVGRVVDALVSAGMWDNTLFVWSSDNGAAIERVTGGKSAYPLRGGYYTNWDGGVRAPGLVNGGYLPDAAAGRSVEGLMHLADWMATFCAVAGCNLSDPVAAAAGLPAIDSLNLWGHISGANKTSPRQEVWFTPLRAAGLNTRSGDAALLVGRHKLIVGNISQASWTGPTYPNSSDWDTWATVEQCTTRDKVGCLFDVFADPTEHRDLAREKPELAASLLKRMQALDETLYDPDRGAPDRDGACERVVQNQGFWGPWL